VASVAVDDSLWDATKQLVHHSRFILFRDAVEGLLDNMAAKSVHAQGESIAANGLGDRDDLIVRTMLKATLYKKVAEAVDHQCISLGDDCLHNLILLFRCAYFELLLKEDGSLLVVVADDLIDDVLPVAAHVSVQQATIVHGFNRGHVL